jgi:surfeit locus 1 family protein
LNLDYPVTAAFKFWLISLAAIIAIVATLALGRWQLSRAAQKEALQTDIELQAQREPLSNSGLRALPDASKAVHRIVDLRGVWKADKTVFLDNRQMNAKAGFYVLTPLVLEDTRSAVLVQRGWAARNFVDRAALPDILTPAGTVEVRGRIVPPPSKLYELGGPELGAIRQNLDLAHFRQESGLDLLPVSVQQSGAASEGLLREWPVVSSSAEKNYGYAFQWFGLSALIFILYVWFQIGKRFISKRSD